MRLKDMTANMGKFIWDRTAYEAWCVGFRRINNGGDLLHDGSGEFSLLKPGFVYWYADPIISNIDNGVYVFTEAYDKWDKKGRIAVSKLAGGHLSKPKIVLEEPFHLSFPEIFEYNGSYYMIPETHSVSQFRFYKMGGSLREWGLFRKIPTEFGFSDTVVYNDNGVLYLITTEKKSDNPYMNRVHVFRITDFESETGFEITEIKTDEPETYGYDKRCGGSLLSDAGEMIRVIQESEDGFYGKCLSYNKVLKLGPDGFAEKALDKKTYIRDLHYRLKGFHRALGIHTYGRCGDYEVVDIKTNSISVAVIVDNIKKKLGIAER